MACFLLTHSVVGLTETIIIAEVLSIDSIITEAQETESRPTDSTCD